MKKTVTDKDEALIALLKVNAREPTASLARKLGLSRTTVQDRLRRLEADGVIAGYDVRLGKSARASGLKAFIAIAIEPRRTAEVTGELKSLSAVEALHSVSGKADLMALVAVPDPARLDELLDTIGAIRGVTDTESFLVLSTKLERR
jgi:DNA-binding Lrp family transcriptional regulator